MDSLALLLQELEKEPTKPKASKRKEIKKIRVDINRDRKTIEKINKTKSSSSRRPTKLTNLYINQEGKKERRWK